MSTFPVAIAPILIFSVVEGEEGEEVEKKEEEDVDEDDALVTARAR